MLVPLLVPAAFYSLHELDKQGCGSYMGFPFMMAVAQPCSPLLFQPYPLVEEEEGETPWQEPR